MSMPEADQAWSAIKLAIWKVITGENLNDGQYVNAYRLTEKLYAAVTEATAARERDPDRRMTITEVFLLRGLSHRDMLDLDGIAHRFVVGAGYAIRIEPGMLRITDAGREALAKYSES